MAEGKRQPPDNIGTNKFAVLKKIRCTDTRESVRSCTDVNRELMQ